MTAASPLTAARQIAAAKAAREAAQAGAVRLAYTTTTGDVGRAEMHAAGVSVAPQAAEFSYEYCFVCSRPTDHVGEHDDLVEAGLAEYDTEEEDWVVRRTALWDTPEGELLRARVREAQDLEVALWLARIEATA